MKIIFVANNNVGDAFSGGDRIFVEFIKNWKEKSEIVLFGSEETIRISRERGAGGIKMIETDSKNLNMQGGIFDFLKHIRRRTQKGLAAIEKEKKLVREADFVYSVSDFYPDFLPAFWLKKKNKKIKWIAGYYLFAPAPWAKDSPYKGKNWIKGFFYWLMQRPSYFLVKRYADFVFVTSEPDVSKFITQKRDRSKIVVVQGGVDITESEKHLNSGRLVPVSERKYDACFVGRFHYQKGVLDLIDIWKLVCQRKSNAKLGIIGAGPLEKEMREKIKKYNLENNVDLLGFKDGKEKYEIFKQSKMMVHPATYDSGGMAAAEGLAWGLPGVSFDLEALKTYYPKGMLKTEAGNKNEFSENIFKLLENEELYKETAKDSHSLIVEVWDWEKRAERIFKLLN